MLVKSSSYPAARRVLDKPSKVCAKTESFIVDTIAPNTRLLLEDNAPAVLSGTYPSSSIAFRTRLRFGSDTFWGVRKTRDTVIVPTLARLATSFIVTHFSLPKVRLLRCDLRAY